MRLYLCQKRFTVAVILSLSHTGYLHKSLLCARLFDAHLPQSRIRKHHICRHAGPHCQFDAQLLQFGEQHFVRFSKFFFGLFGGYGYTHLEFSVSNDKKCFALMEYLNENGFPAKRTVRRGVSSLYIKESESIEDFMTYIGAAQASLTIMNAKIVRDIRNNVNRRMNCDAANLYKTTGAATAQVHAIKHLIESGRFDFLPDQLKETARLRLENPQASLDELAGLHEDYITKSGVSHRLAKIVDFDKK